MTVSRARHGARPRLPRSRRLDLLLGSVLLLAAAAFAATALTASGGAPGLPTKTAFASASSGNYAVVARTDGNRDAIYVAPADGGPPLQVATVAHLDGYASSGAVSPDRRHLALIVADAGSVAHPGASLILLDLDSGALTRLAVAVDPGQDPVWTPDGRRVVVTRSTPVSGSAVAVAFASVAVDLSGESSAGSVHRVLGAYAVGFDATGRLITVAIDAAGSIVRADGADLLRISPYVTRDWRLSPDGTQLGFIEADLAAGLKYLGRVVSLDGAQSDTSAVQSSNGAEQLGVAWAPGASRPAFGVEPGPSSQGDSSQRAVLAAPGFDIPLAYSRDGEALAVEHGTGSGFSQPGQLGLQVVARGTRLSLNDFSRFYGWAAR